MRACVLCICVCVHAYVRVEGILVTSEHLEGMTKSIFCWTIFEFLASENSVNINQLEKNE